MRMKGPAASVTMIIVNQGRSEGIGGSVVMDGKRQIKIQNL